ncbi:hypothetical protein Ddc_04131 [Ditylenchus destructor]|nr:hypothetical protein Ddc_04131 [Ditylenchus destructor]
MIILHSKDATQNFLNFVYTTDSEPKSAPSAASLHQMTSPPDFIATTLRDLFTLYNTNVAQKGELKDEEMRRVENMGDILWGTYGETFAEPVGTPVLTWHGHLRPNRRIVLFFPKY